MRFKARCERVKVNRGNTQVLLIKRSNFTKGSQEERVLLDVLADSDEFQDGEEYTVEIMKSHPRPNGS